VLATTHGPSAIAGRVRPHSVSRRAGRLPSRGGVRRRHAERRPPCIASPVPARCASEARVKPGLASRRAHHVARRLLTTAHNRTDDADPTRRPAQAPVRSTAAARGRRERQPAERTWEHGTPRRSPCRRLRGWLLGESWAVRCSAVGRTGPGVRSGARSRATLALERSDRLAASPTFGLSTRPVP
jgi:hypothetical protein